MNKSNVLEKIESTFYNRFYTDIKSSKIKLNIEIARILFGAIMAIKYLDVILIPFLETNERIYAFGSFLFSIQILFGFFTPLGLIMFQVLTLVTYPVIWNLSSQINTLTCFSLFFLQAGKSISLDHWLRQRISLFSNLLKKYEQITLDANSENLAKIRLFVIYLFWGVCFSAMSFHFKDQLWLKGEVLQILFKTDYLTDFAHFFRTWEQVSFWSYDLFFKIGLFLQGTWELLLFPLVLLPFGLYFIIFQGLAFFISCMFFVNLSYLPTCEIILWLILFGYPEIFKKNKLINKTYQSDVNNKFYRYFKVASISVTTLMILIMSLRIVDYKPIEELKYKIWRKRKTNSLIRKTFLFFAQEEVNVINIDDLNMGNTFILIKDLQNNKLVDFMEPNGGRLDYLRNEYLYFKLSLKYQRSSLKAKIVTNDNKIILTQRSEDLINKILIYHECLSGISQSQKYEVSFFRKDLIPNNYNTLSWSKPIKVIDRIFTSPDFDKNSIYCKFTERINLGHLNTEYRKNKI